MFQVKKNSINSLLEEFDVLFHKCENAFKQSRSLERAKDLAHGLINCSGRRTITGLITACGKQFKDWSSDYRLFQGDRMNLERLFDTVRSELVSNDLINEDPICAHMDDTVLKKSGKKIVGTAWRRDPLGPPFHTNFIWGQRFIQISISLPEKTGISRSRAIPVDFYHCPTIAKPQKSEDQDAWKIYKEKQKQAKLSQKGVERIKILRENLDNDGAKHRELIISVDGSYTNETVLRTLPERTTIIGRIRKDCKLNRLPNCAQKAAGRNRVYGSNLPTPEQIRKDSKVEWAEVKAFAAGKCHTFNVKVIKDVRWRKAGAKNLQLIIIRPLAYRLTKNSKLLYRQPAYLICTDENLNIDKLLQAYLWRWEIEVNFKEEKTFFGCGQAQVRSEHPIEKVPAFISVVYSLMQIAAHRASNRQQQCLTRTKWYPKKRTKRVTTGDLINEFKINLYTKNSSISFPNFVKMHEVMRSRKNQVDPTISAVFFSRK